MLSFPAKLPARPAEVAYCGDPVRRLFVLLTLLVTAAVLSGCGARAHVAVDVRGNGSGEVVATVILDRDAVSAVGDVEARVETSDLRRQGWTITVSPSDQTTGSRTITARRGCASIAEINAALDELSGEGAPFSGLHVSQSRSLSGVKTTFDGSLDLRAESDAFRLGELGVDVNGVRSRTGVDLRTAIPVSLSVNLPEGKQETTPHVNGEGNWVGVPGERVTVSATGATSLAGAKSLIALGLLSMFALAGVWLWWRPAGQKARHSRNSILGLGRRGDVQTWREWIAHGSSQTHTDSTSLDALWASTERLTVKLDALRKRRDKPEATETVVHDAPAQREVDLNNEVDQVHLPSSEDVTRGL